jgi:hypothetical protein
MKSALPTTTGLLLSEAVLATGCGGGGGDTMRATLTDDGCTYEGDTTPAPGLSTIEVENKTTHFASFAMWKLAPGTSTEDVQHAYTQALADFKRTHKPPKPFTGSVDDLYAPNFGVGAETDRRWPLRTWRPEATSELPLNESSGRFVIVCFEQSSADTRASSSALTPPSAVYVATELDVR